MRVNQTGIEINGLFYPFIKGDIEYSEVALLSTSRKSSYAIVGLDCVREVVIEPDGSASIHTMDIAIQVGTDHLLYSYYHNLLFLVRGGKVEYTTWLEGERISIYKERFILVESDDCTKGYITIVNGYVYHFDKVVDFEKGYVCSNDKCVKVLWKTGQVVTFNRDSHFKVSIVKVYTNMYGHTYISIHDYVTYKVYSVNPIEATCMLDADGLFEFKQEDKEYHLYYNEGNSCMLFENGFHVENVSLELEYFKKHKLGYIHSASGVIALSGRGEYYFCHNIAFSELPNKFNRSEYEEIQNKQLSSNKLWKKK